MLGLALQLLTVRYLGTFLEDPLDVPNVVLDYAASQIGVADPSCVKAYMERDMTRYNHRDEISKVYGYQVYSAASDELLEWVDKQAWTSGDGPKALFYASIGWLRARRVLLPGVTTLRDDVAKVRNAAEDRLYDTLAEAVTAEQAADLELILKVPEGQRKTRLELWRHGEKTPTGRSMVASLNRVSQIAGLDLRAVDVDSTGVPPRRLIELARTGPDTNVPKLADYTYHRKLVTLLATIRWLEVVATDDALELLDVFMTNELIGRASKKTDQEKLKRAPMQARHADVLSRAVEVLFHAETWGDDVPLAVVWDAIETAVGSRARLRAAMEGVQELIPPPDADPGGEWRIAAVERFKTVRGFIRLLCKTIDFGATVEATPVKAMQDLGELVDAGETVNVPKDYLDARKCNVHLAKGWMQPLVLPKDRPSGTVNRNAYVFCVLELFHKELKSRDIFAKVSDRWSDPRAKLLSGEKWEQAKQATLGALLLPEDPDGLLADLSSNLDTAWCEVAGGLVANAQLSVDTEGKLRLSKDEALEDRPSLKDLKKRLEGMMPKVDLSEQILEVMTWHPGFPAAFTSVTGGRSRPADLHTSVAALLTAHSLNVGLSPVIDPDQPALTRDRLAHIDQHYLRPDNYSAANAILIDAQADIGLAQAWGGGMVAAVDGIRFVVPVRSVDARPNPKYFGRKKGVTWLNMINDQRVGLAGKVVSGTPKDTLHFVDLVFNPDSGKRPEVLITDQGSYVR